MDSHQAVTLFFALDILFIFSFSFANGSGCRTLTISQILKDKSLSTNHTIRSIQPITDAGMCRIQCYLEPSCLTFNFCEKQGNFVCELTNSDHVRHELIDKAGCTYYGSENHCSSNPCSKNATCQGDFLSDPVPYKCICPAGYGGDNCIDINECSEGTHDCHVNATCSNEIGGFNCTCKSGFHGNGKHCQDIDECASGTHNCHVNATCTNSISGFNCSCKQCHFGNGTHCQFTNFNRRVIFDFEDGGKAGWTLTGTAFNNQPTYGDNSAKRNKPSNLQGTWWIGSFENRPSPSHQYGGQQGDWPKGTMTSPPFIICGSRLTFKIGGGCTIDQQRAELLIEGNVVAQAIGACREYMDTKSWNVEQYRGKTARVRLVDNHRGGWGHINFDYLVEHQ